MNTKKKESQARGKIGIKNSGKTQKKKSAGASQIKNIPAFRSSHNSRFYEDIVATIREPLLVLDGRLHVLYANQSFYKAFKVTARNTLGRRVYTLGNRQWDIPRLRTLLEEIIPQKTRISDYQVEHDFATIGKRSMLLNARRISLPPEKEQMILLAIEDVTERMHTEQALQVSEERFRRAFETAKDGILLIDKDKGRVVNSNRSAQLLLGYSIYEMKKQKIWNFGFMKDAVQFRHTARQLDEVDFVDFLDTTVKTRRGRQIPVDVYMIDKAGVFQCNIREVSERKRHEEKILHSEAQLITAQSVAKVGSWQWDIKNDQLTWSDEMYRIFGISKEKFNGKLSDVVAKAIHPLDHPAVEAANRSVMREGKPVPLEYRVVWPDGSQHWVWAQGGKLIRDEQGNPSIFSGIVMDITERKQAENNLKRHNRTLEMVSATNTLLIHATRESELLDGVCKIAVKKGGYCMAWIGYKEQDEKKSVRSVVQCGFEEGYLDKVNITWADRERGRGPTGIAIRTNQPALARNIPGDPSYRPWRKAAIKRGYLSSIALPLSVEKEVIGAFNIYATELDAFDQEEITLLVELAGDLSFGISALRVKMERERAEQALQVSEKNFRTLFENSPISLSVQDFSAAKRKLDGLKAKGITNIPDYLRSHPGFVAECAALVKVIDVNQSTLDYFRAKKKEDIQDLFRNVTPQFLEDFSRELEAVARGQTSYKAEATRSIMSNENKFHLLSWSAMPGCEKDLSRVLLSVVDISERKQKEHSMQILSDAQLQLAQMEDLPSVYQLVGERVQELVPNGYVVVSALDDELQANRVVGMFGFGSLYDKMAKSFKIDPSKNPYFLKDMTARELRRFRSGKLEKLPGGLHALLTRKIPKPLCLAAEKQLKISGIYTQGFVFSGQHFGGVSILARSEIIPNKEMIELLVRQISISINRIKTRLALTESENRFRGLYENALVGIYRTTPQGKILLANPALVRMLGYQTFAELASHDLNREGFIPAFPRQEFQRRIEQKGVIQNYESAWKRKDGSIIYTLESGWMERDRDGKNIFYEGMVEDITERKQAEEALRNRAEELSALEEMVLGITSPHELDQLLQMIVERATRLLAGSAGGLYLCDQAKKEAHCVVSFKTAGDFTGTVLKYGEGAAGTVAQTGQPLIVDDYHSWSKRAPVFDEKQPFNRLVSVPMLWQGQVTGVIHVLRGEHEEPFKQENLNLLSIFANHAATAVENSRLVQALKQELAERKQAEGALRKSEELYRSLFENMLNGFAYCQMQYDDQGAPLDFIYLSVNKAFETQTGLKGVVGKKVSEVLPGIQKSDPGLLEIYGRVASTGKPESLEIFLEAMQEWFSISVYRPAQGYFVAVFDVVTERKRSEQEINDLAKFPDENPNPVLRISAQGKILYANRGSEACLKTWGKKTGQALPGKIKDLALHSLQSKSNQEVEIQCGECVFSFIFAPIVEANYINLYGRDITERKRAEISLQASEKRYRSLFEDSPIALLEEDYSALKRHLDALKAQGVADLRAYLEAHPQEVADCAALVRLMDVNQATLDLYKARNKTEFLNKNKSLILTPQVLPNFRDDLVKISEGQTEFNLDEESKTLTGEEIDIHFSWKVSPGHESDFSKVLISIDDITERKRMEEGLRASRERLANLSRRLSESQEAERRRIARELHDEVGQTLTALNISLEGVALNAADEAARDRVGETQGLVRNLFSQVNALSTDLRPRVLDDLGLIPGLIDLFNRLTTQTGLAVDFKYKGLEKIRLASEVEINAYRIIQETLTNVIRHSGSKTVFVRLQVEGKILSIQVQDEGKGFNFHQAYNAKGSMGLLGMKERAEQIGGYMEVQTAPGEGTLITCQLPLDGSILEEREHDRR